MQKRGEVQKGFFLVAVALLAAAFFASFYTDPTGEAVRRTTLTPRQPLSLSQNTPFSFSFSSLFSKSSKIFSSGESIGPTTVRTCSGLGACNPACEDWKICMQTGGTTQNPICSCVPTRPAKIGESCGKYSPGIYDKVIIPFCTDTIGCEEGTHCSYIEKCFCVAGPRPVKLN